MFLYIYVDYLHLYKPGALTDILAGVVFEFDISQTFVVIALTSVAIPMFMILLSMTLPARVNRPSTSSWQRSTFPSRRSTWRSGSGWCSTVSASYSRCCSWPSSCAPAWTWPRTSSAPAPEPALSFVRRSRWDGRHLVSIPRSGLTEDFGDPLAVNAIDLDMPEVARKETKVATPVADRVRSARTMRAVVQGVYEGLSPSAQRGGGAGARG